MLKEFTYYMATEHELIGVVNQRIKELYIIAKENAKSFDKLQEERAKTHKCTKTTDELQCQKENMQKVIDELSDLVFNGRGKSYDELSQENANLKGQIEAFRYCIDNM